MKEVKEPFEITFPLKGAGLKTARPDEEEVEEEEPLDLTPGDPSELQPKRRPRKVSMRPDYIDSDKWVKMPYARRLAIHRAETEMAERAAGRALTAPSGEVSGETSPCVAAESAEHQSVLEAKAADPAVGGAPDAQPVIVEFCCSPDSSVGSIETVGKPGKAIPAATVHRITLENCDVTTEAVAAKALLIARENQEPCC